jgi:hypothetical protein
MSGNWYWDMQADLRLWELWRTKYITHYDVSSNTVNNLIRLHLLGKVRNGD